MKPDRSACAMQAHVGRAQQARSSTVPRRQGTMQIRGRCVSPETPGRGSQEPRCSRLGIAPHACGDGSLGSPEVEPGVLNQHVHGIEHVHAVRVGALGWRLCAQMVGPHPGAVGEGHMRPEEGSCKSRESTWIAGWTSSANTSAHGSMGLALKQQTVVHSESSRKKRQLSR